MENLSNKNLDYSIARERVYQLKKFYGSLIFFVLVFTVYFIWKYYKKHGDIGEINFLEFNNWSVIFWIWGLILVLKGIKLFFFNQNWERKMMEKQLNK